MRIRWQFVFLFLSVVVLSTACMHTAEVRHSEVFYFADVKQPTLHLKVLRRTPILSTGDANKVIAQLSPGQSVEVIGWGEAQYVIKARSAIGHVKGWVAAEALEAPPVWLQEKLRQCQDRAEQHRNLIERHEVVVGMTRADVRAILGKPDRTARVRTPSGDEERWFYTTYKYAPHYVQQQNEGGQVNQKLSYGRVPTGNKVITFWQDAVVEIGDKESAESKAPGKSAATQAGE